MKIDIGREKYFEIANLSFNISNRCPFCLLLPSFTPFEIAKEQNVDFHLSIAVDDQESIMQENQLVTHFSTSFGNVNVYINKTGYLYEITNNIESLGVIYANQNNDNAQLILHTTDCLKCQQLASSSVFMLYALNSVKKESLIIHASVSILNDEAYIFYGPSGVGKSTLSDNLCAFFPEAWILNDDNPVIFVNSEGYVCVSGSPWSGKRRFYINKSYIVKGFFSIKQHKRNKLILLDNRTFLQEIMPSCCRNAFNSVDILDFVDFVYDIVTKTRGYIYFTQDSLDAAEYLKDKISEKHLANQQFLSLVMFAFSNNCNVRFVVNGNSMYPTFKHDKTKVIISNKIDKIRVGDIILAKYQNRCILHRVMKINIDKVTTKGDGNKSTETIKLSDIIGMVKYWEDE